MHVKQREENHHLGIRYITLQFPKMGRWELCIRVPDELDSSETPWLCAVCEQKQD